MKKIALCLSTLLIASITNIHAQCNVKVSANKTKICSNETATLSAVSSNIQSLPNFSDSKKVFDVSDLKLDPTIIGLIQNGLLKDVSYPFTQNSGDFTLSLNGYQLKNTIIASGSIDVSIVTDLKQDLKVVFELPYFKIKGKSIKDSIFVDGKTAGTGMQTFFKTFDLKDAVIDFSAGNPSNYNTVKYIVKPSLKITTTTFSAKETGSLKLDFKNIKLTENLTYVWRKGVNVLNDVNTPTIDVTESGRYVVTSTSNCGTSKDSIDIQVVQLPSKSVTKTGNLSFCEGDSVKLSADGTGSYKWSNNDITKDAIIKKSGSYTVTVTNDICSITSDPIQVTVNANPEIKLNHKDTTIIVGSEFNLKATGGVKYEWNDKSTNDNLTVKNAGTYSVTGKNEAGCSSSASIKVEVREKGAGLSNLNGLKVAISPNPSSDVVNITIEEFKNKAITLVDLKGNLVFSQDLNATNTTITVNTFAKGVYILNIVDGSKTVVNSQRIVIE